MILFNSVLLILVKGEKILRMFRSYVFTPEDAVKKLIPNEHHTVHFG